MLVGLVLPFGHCPLQLNQSQGEMYISPDRTVGRPQLGRKGDMRCSGVLSVTFKTAEMHIPPWYWFSSSFIFTRVFPLSAQMKSNGPIIAFQFRM